MRLTGLTSISSPFPSPESVQLPPCQHQLLNYVSLADSSLRCGRKSSLSNTALITPLKGRRKGGDVRYFRIKEQKRRSRIRKQFERDAWSCGLFKFHARYPAADKERSTRGSKQPRTSGWSGGAEGLQPTPIGRSGPRAAGGDLRSPRLLGGGRARRKEAASSLRPGPTPTPAPTLTLVDGLKSAREVTVLAITVHFTPERRHRNPPAAAARHLGGDAGGAGRPLPRKRISEVDKRRRKPVVAKRFGVGNALIPESVSEIVILAVFARNLRG